MEGPGLGGTGGRHPGVGAVCELRVAAGGELGHQHASAVGGFPRCWEVGPRRSELGVMVRASPWAAEPRWDHPAACEQTN